MKPAIKEALALCELFAPGDRSLAAEVRESIEAPALYRKKHRRRLDGRAEVDSPRPMLAWLAITDGLAARKRLFEIDWKTFPEDVLWSVDHFLPKNPARWAWCDVDRYEDVYTSDFLKVVGRALASEGIALVHLDQESDSYALSSLPLAHVARAKALVKKGKAAGLGAIESFSPATRPAPPKPLPPPPLEPKIKKPKPFVVRGNADMHLDKPAHTGGMVYQREDGGLSFADASTWPPKKKILSKDYASRVFWTGKDVIVSAQKTDYDHGGKQVGQILRCAKAGAKGVPLPPPPPGVDVDGYGMLGGELALFPEDHSYRGKKTRAPLVLSRGQWKPLNLPRVRIPPPPAKGRSDWDFVVQGRAQTGDGAEVIVWGERGFERVGTKHVRFVKNFDLGTIPPPGNPVVCAPCGADGFAFISKGKLWHARRGQRVRRRLRTFDRLDQIAAGPGGTILLSVIRTARTVPAALVFFPDEEAFIPVPPGAMHLHGTDFLDAIGWSEPMRLVLGMWDLGNPTMAAVPLDSLLKLPKKNEKTGR